MFVFGQALVENGQIVVDENTEVGKAMASNPRTAIGIIDELHYIFVVADGRSSMYDKWYWMAGCVFAVSAVMAGCIADRKACSSKEDKNE